MDQTEIPSLKKFFPTILKFYNFLKASSVLLDSAGVVEVLVNSGRQIDAVNLAYAFDLTEKFSPVALLKSYLKEARKASSPVKPGNASPTVQVHDDSQLS